MRTYWTGKTKIRKIFCERKVESSIFFCSKNFFFLTEIPKKPSRKENERIKKDNGSRADAGGRHTNKSGETRRHKEIRKESQKENVEYSFLFFFFFNHRPLLLQADNPQRRSQRVFFFFLKRGGGKWNKKEEEEEEEEEEGELGKMKIKWEERKRPDGSLRWKGRGHRRVGAPMAGADNPPKKIQ